MRNRVAFRMLLAIAALTFVATLCGTAMAQGRHKEKRSFRNKDVVSANDFHVFSLNGLPIYTGAVRRQGAKAFRDTALSSPYPAIDWPKETLTGTEIPPESSVTVSVTTDDTLITGYFTRNDVPLLSQRVLPFFSFVITPGGPVRYKLTNTTSETISLTDIDVRNHGNPASIYTAGDYVGGGVLIPNVVATTLAPGDTVGLYVGTVPPGFSCSISYSVAPLSNPSEAYADGRADEPSSYAGVGSRGDAAVRLQLWPNVPNPFTIRTSIPFVTPLRGTVRVEILDPGGRRVRLLRNEWLEAGSHAVDWDGRDDSGARIETGVYWSRVTMGGRSEARRILLIR